MWVLLSVSLRTARTTQRNSVSWKTKQNTGGVWVILFFERREENTFYSVAQFEESHGDKHQHEMFEKNAWVRVDGLFCNIRTIVLIVWAACRLEIHVSVIWGLMKNHFSLYNLTDLELSVCQVDLKVLEIHQILCPSVRILGMCHHVQQSRFFFPVLGLGLADLFSVKLVLYHWAKVPAFSKFLVVRQCSSLNF